jgi:hypothetical protein
MQWTKVLKLTITTIKNNASTCANVSTRGEHRTISTSTENLKTYLILRDFELGQLSDGVFAIPSSALQSPSRFRALGFSGGCGCGGAGL